MLDRRTLLLGGAGLGIAAAIGAETGKSPPKNPPPCGPESCPYHLLPDGTPSHLYRSPQYATGLGPVRAYTGVVLDLPPQYRTKNWGGGSCVHASNVNLLLWMGMPEMAAWWRDNYSGGEYDGRLISRLEAAGLKFAYVYDDPAFFDWCTRTRRGAGIFYKPSHSINFVGRDAQYAYLLDNNAVSYPENHGHYERVEWNTFIRQWRGYGGFAWTLIYDPQPGDPVLSLG